MQYQEQVDAKERYQRELEQSQLQYQEAVDEKGRYQRELEQLQLQYQEAVKQHKVQRNMLQNEK